MARWGIDVAVLSTLVLSVLLFAGIQRLALADILGLAHTLRPGPEPWLLPVALIATSCVLLAPAVAVAAVLRLCGCPKASRRTFVALASLALFVAMVDLDLLRSIGRHVGEIVALALAPHGHVAGGDTGNWVPMVAKWAAMAVSGTLLVTEVSERAMFALRRQLSPFLRRALVATTAVAIPMLLATPILLLQSWRNSPVVERMYASALFDIRLGDGDAGQGNLDPALNGLYTQLSASYKAAFPGLTFGRPGDNQQVALPGRPPNVILIVTESLRHDVFGPELMPRLSRWAENGLVSTQHDSGTVYSQSAMFSLLYGRSSAVFHQTLDAHVPPQLCVSLRNMGYECAYFTGHPKEWQRREEFLNDRTMDHFVHDDRGTWPEWDKRALDGAVHMAQTSEKPLFAIVLLMSSHFEYQYPPEYEIDRPVANTVWKVTMVSGLGPEAEVPHRNRYRNCMRFIDDIVGGAIDQLDPKENLVVFTGDHGESINDDGHYTHGYSFADIITRTPFAMVGPGVKPERLETPTYHVDVLRSVLHAASGRSIQIPHTHGVDWFAGERHTSQLEAHSPSGGRKIEAQLRVDGRRLRLDLDLDHPHVTVLGFEDELAHLVATPVLTERDTREISGAFETQLELLRR